uniref:Ribonuclease H protein At1g65750 family n=1 Tax=Cajanus cajan TaxID=3821 RepID=A0A151T765_CAJCA|nr:Putative ribonuclease H protein At1g65750 family [Cajanus cajan]KYP64838.1 Putative ribonuclease H protein At1g65750 family [Cajanus cajan]
MVTLVNSVVTSIPTYTMQMQWIPQQVCDKLDLLGRQFIWSGNMDRKINLVKWDMVIKKRKDGGLGVRVARWQNIALLGKLI